VQKEHEKDLRAKDSEIQAFQDALKKMSDAVMRTRIAMGAELKTTQSQLAYLEQRQHAAELEASTLRGMAEKLKSMVDAGSLQIVNRKGRMTLKLQEDILFPAGSKKLKKEGVDALLSVAGVLKSVPDRDFLIAGHTDNVAVSKTGGFRSNWDLSTARAVEVVSLMVANEVLPEHLAAVGYGEYDPIGDNQTPEGRQQNRRLEIIVMPKIEQLDDSP
jgi:chemotaxis protein MotB